MTAELEPWHDVPTPFEAAKRAHRASGPTEAQLARMLARASNEAMGNAALRPEAVSSLGQSLPYLLALTLALAGFSAWRWQTTKAPVSTVSRAPSQLPASTDGSRLLGLPAEPSPSSVTPVPPAERAPSVETPPVPRVRARQTKPVEPAVALEPPPVVDVASELDLLGRARRVMPANPERALALANEHQSLYPSGVLAQERELLAVEALLKLRQRGEAESRSQRFSRDFPRSVHAPRMQALLEETNFGSEEPEDNVTNDPRVP